MGEFRELGFKSTKRPQSVSIHISYHVAVAILIWPFPQNLDVGVAPHFPVNGEFCTTVIIVCETPQKLARP